jgi:trans-aconitate methyltransferase
MPDRETRLSAMLDVVESVAGESPRVLDLAGGTGSITRRLLARLPAATSVVLDIDPVLLSIAPASFAGDDRVLVVEADLADPKWPAALSPARFDAVLTATAALVATTASGGPLPGAPCAVAARRTARQRRSHA